MPAQDTDGGMGKLEEIWEDVDLRVV